MTDPAAPWWADVQHLRPDADREREQRSRETRDAALGDVRAQADATPQRPRGRFARAAEALGTVATLERTDRSEPRTDWGRDSPDLTPAPADAPVTDTWWLDEQPEPRRDRVSTEDWLALTEPTERRDPETGRKVVEIRGQVDGVRGVAAPDPEPTARASRAAGRRPRGGAVERMYGRPDRIALWAFVLGMVLILVALIGTPQAGAATRLGDRPLKAGMEGRDVRHLQLRLKRVGFLDAPATARFGALTRRAVKRYQRSRCLTADGIAGPSTIRALRSQRRPCRRGSRSTGRSSGRSRKASASRKAYRSVDLGARTLAKGMRGRDVRTLQSLLGLGTDGVFGNQTKRAVKRFQRRAGLTADGAVGPVTRRTLAARRMRVRKATWYGPGLYGNRTACGQKLTRRLHGVAHRSLPCGSRVLLSYGGRFVAARVVDRGPYAHGAVFDLTSATARKIGLSSTDHLRARY